MKVKIVSVGEVAKQKLLKGVETLSGAVKITLGPKGRNVVVDRIHINPTITNDGVTIAKEIELKDEIENMGCAVMKGACVRTNDIAGDGTTTAIVLAENIFKLGLKYSTMGANPILLRNGIKKAIKVVVDELRLKSEKIENYEDICKVASISSGDEETGNIIAKAYEKVGIDGVITVEDGNGVESSLDFVEGLTINRGYISPYMCNDKNKLIAELDNPYILITDKKISSIHEILPILEKVSNVGGSLFIIAEDVEGDALTTLVVNNARNVFKCLAVKAPYFGDRRKRVLEDIAISVGGDFIANDVYNNFSRVELDNLGRAKKVTANKDNSTIIGACGEKEKIENRVAELKSELECEKVEYNIETLLGRISNLNGGVAVIKVGATSEIEMLEKKLRIEDALNATKSAIEEGVVAGGGVALLKTRNKLKEFIDTLSGDEKCGAEIILSTLESPIRQISKNAGVDDGVVVRTVLSDENANFGYDAYRDVFCDMIQAGVIDPVKVTRTAMETAGSVASTLLTTECVVVQDKSKISIDE